VEQKVTHLDNHAQHISLHTSALHLAGDDSDQFLTSGAGGRRVEVSRDGVRLQRCRSFGFKAEFEITNVLKGRIEQDGFNFELFINGRSFTELSKVQYAYCISAMI